MAENSGRNEFAILGIVKSFRKLQVRRAIPEKSFATLRTFAKLDRTLTAKLSLATSNLATRLAPVQPISWTAAHEAIKTKFVTDATRQALRKTVTQYAWFIVHFVRSAPHLGQ